MRERLRWPEWSLLALITAAAAVLRLVALGKVPADPFYDAAVRSMGLSWHNFFFGAFEPGGSVSIDKPPVDLWLQVISTKLFGFNNTTLKLPEALAGTLSVPLLFAAVRRVWSTRAGFAAAIALTLLPIEVITSRSDTMDGVMMLLVVVALFAIVRAIETDRMLWLLLGAAALGISFDVKLLESLVALPGLALMAYLGLRGSRRRRLTRVVAAGALYVVVALAWLTATLIAPAHDRPWAIGSTNGSAWNAAFVFNGTDRLKGKSPEAGGAVYEPGHSYPVATQQERDAIPIVPASATRLFARIGPLSGERLGLELLISLILGLPALALGLRREAPPEPAGASGAVTGAPPPEPPTEALSASERPHTALAGPADPDEPRPTAPADGDGAPGESATGRPRLPPPPTGPTRRPDSTAGAEDLPWRLRRAAAGGFVVWALVGIALFSHMERLHPRYVEAFMPAVAAMLGIGLAWVTSRREWLRLGLLAVAMAATVYYAERLLYGHPTVWWVTLLAALAALASAAAAMVLGRGRGQETGSSRGPTALLSVLALALAAAAVLVLPLKADLLAIKGHTSDAGLVGALPAAEQHDVSAYLLAHQGSARYEMAAASSTQIGSLIVQDVKPVIVLTTYNGQVFTNVAKLQRLIANGEVRYAFLPSYCTTIDPATNAACSEPVEWIRAHGKDVSLEAGLPHHKILYLLPGATP